MVMYANTAKKYEGSAYFYASEQLHQPIIVNLSTVFPLTFRLISECPNFLETIVPNALKGCLRALNY